MNPAVESSCFESRILLRKNFKYFADNWTKSILCLGCFVCVDFCFLSWVDHNKGVHIIPKVCFFYPTQERLRTAEVTVQSPLIKNVQAELAAVAIVRTM